MLHVFAASPYKLVSLVLSPFCCDSPDILSILPKYGKKLWNDKFKFVLQVKGMMKNHSRDSDQYLQVSEVTLYLP